MRNAAISEASSILTLIPAVIAVGLIGFYNMDANN